MLNPNSLNKALLDFNKSNPELLPETPDFSNSYQASLEENQLAFDSQKDSLASLAKKGHLASLAHKFSKSKSTFSCVDRYKDNLKTYQWNKNVNPMIFASVLQKDYYFAELYVDGANENESRYDSHDKTVLKRVLTEELKPTLIKNLDHVVLQNKSKSSLTFPDFSEDEDEKNQEKARLKRSFIFLILDRKADQETQEKQKRVSYLQMLILGAVLLRRSFEKIGLHYELSTQIRLNEHITKMYKDLDGVDLKFQNCV